MKKNKLSIFRHISPYSWKTFHGALENLSYIPRVFKWGWQRIMRGYADCDIWNFDSFLADLIPAGRRALTTGLSYPMDFKSCDEWHEWLNDTANMFDEGFDDDWWADLNMSIEETKVEGARRKEIATEAMRRFVDKFGDLWD